MRSSSLFRVSVKVRVRVRLGLGLWLGSGLRLGCSKQDNQKAAGMPKTKG